MEPAPKPDDELQRLAALYALGVLDSQPDESIDRVTRMALVTLIDDDRQWVMSGFGDPVDLPRSTSFCGYAILGPEVLTVSDTTKDHRFADSPFVTSDPSIRFYAGAPLSFAGQRVGTICVLDERPRELSEDDVELLKDLAGTIEAEFAHARLAVVDDLTGLYNRRGFLRAAGQLLALAQRNAAPVTVFTFDLDGLKTVNDREGHAAGDALIVDAARLLSHTFRSSDLVARVGGDEFSVLACGPCDPDAIVRRLAEVGSGGPVLSVGWAVRDAGSEPSLPELLAEADAKMYADKASRRTNETD